MSKVVTGQFQYPNGTPAASATLQLQLSQDATVTSTSQIAPTLLYIVLDSEGNIPAETVVWANDELTPSGTYYIASVKAPNFGFVYGPENWPIAGTSPINVNLIPPGQSAPPAQIVIAGDVAVSGIPANGQIIVATGSNTAQWENIEGGTVTSVATAGIATGGPITHSGTVTVLGTSGNGSATAVTDSGGGQSIATTASGMALTADGRGKRTRFRHPAFQSRHVGVRRRGSGGGVRELAKPPDFGRHRGREQRRVHVPLRAWGQLCCLDPRADFDCWV